MGRQEQPLDAGDGPLALFALDLREVRRRAGSPPYLRLAASTNYSASTLAEAAAGRRLPSDAVLAAFVTACGGDPEEWERRRVETHRAITAPAVAPRAEPDPVAGSGAAQAPTAAAEGPVQPVRQPVRQRVQQPVRPPRRPALLPRLLASAAVVVFALLFQACVPGDTAAPRPVTAADRAPLRGAARWLRPGTDIPARYRDLIVEAGTSCPEPEVTPALIAAILKAESGFDPNLSDPARDEYGIARWTPRVLRSYLPADRQGAVPEPPFTAEDSILAVGRMLCAIAPELRGVAGDPELNLAASYESATWVVRTHDAARLATIQPYLDQVRATLPGYRPVG
ncbi:helix-turn-helix domain-containing protein [Kitasatospora sp. NPDC058965]|uniref:helix-turn-helix domain-containing protein n=1 Tax=Kitasatospora sp. NPDC058965 TaxID=3346682 RepID=UPI0036D0042D